MTPGRRNNGAALPGALVTLAVSAALTAALAGLARTELLLARSRRTAAAALAAADGCLAEVTGDLPAGWDLQDVLDGPDGVGGTADDGTIAAPPSCRATAAAAGVLPAARLVVSVQATLGDGLRNVDAVVGRAAEPGMPALLWVADAAALGPIGGALALDGADAHDPAVPAVAALAAAGTFASLDAWLDAQAGHLTLGAATPAPIVAPPPPLAALVARASVGPHLGAEALVAAGPPPPALAFVAGDLVVDAARAGAGLLVVDGTLDVQAPLDFTGVIAATRGIRVAATGRLVVNGALWATAPGVGPALVVDGQTSVTQDRGALAAADALLALPRRAAVLGLRDLG
jgi:hypothetical protein